MTQLHKSIQCMHDAIQQLYIISATVRKESQRNKLGIL